MCLLNTWVGGPHRSGAVLKRKERMKQTYRGKPHERPCGPREKKEPLYGIARTTALAPANIPFCLSNLLHGPMALSSLSSASYFHIVTINLCN